MNGYDKYEKLIASRARDYILLIKKSEHTNNNLYLDESSFFGKLFYGFTEISSTLESIKLSMNLISLSPPRSKKIKKIEYLKYHINAYFHEIYILKERLNKYATTITREYRKSHNKTKAEEAIKPLFDIIKVTFEGVANTRSAHVHSRRFSDEDLDRLSTITFAAETDPEFDRYANIGYKYLKDKWVRTIKKSKNSIMEILDIYFDTLFSVITENNKIIEPNEALKQSANQD